MLQPLGRKSTEQCKAMRERNRRVSSALDFLAWREASGAEPGGDGDAAEVGPGAKESPAPGTGGTGLLPLLVLSLSAPALATAHRATETSYTPCFTSLKVFCLLEKNHVSIP